MSTISKARIIQAYGFPETVKGLRPPKLVLTRDAIFASINEAAKYHGVHRNTMSKWCRDPLNKDFEILENSYTGDKNDK